MKKTCCLEKEVCIFNIPFIVVHLLQVKLQKCTVNALNFEGIKFHDFLTIKIIHFCKIIYPRKVPKPQNREIKYEQSQISAEFKIPFSNI